VEIMSLWRYSSYDGISVLWSRYSLKRVYKL
jgi:hypothetical protein